MGCVLPWSIGDLQKEVPIAAVGDEDVNFFWLGQGLGGVVNAGAQLKIVGNTFQQRG